VNGTRRDAQRTLADKRRDLVAAAYLRMLDCENDDARTLENLKRRLLTEEMLEYIDLSNHDDLTALSGDDLDELARAISSEVLGNAEDVRAVDTVRAWLPYVLGAMDSAERTIHARMLEGPNLL
jgi:hypothetical protein